MGNGEENKASSALLSGPRVASARETDARSGYGRGGQVMVTTGSASLCDLAHVVPPLWASVSESREMREGVSWALGPVLGGGTTVALVGLMQCDGDSGDRQGCGDKVLVWREKWKLESKAMAAGKASWRK